MKNIRFQSLSHGLTKVLKLSGTVALVLMVAMIFVNILSRAFFSVTFGVTEEWPVWLMIWSVFVFIGVNIQENAHISVDLLADKLKGKKRSMLNIFISVIMIVFGILFLYACWSDMLNDKMIHVNTITSVPVPLWIVKLCMPLGMLFFLFNAIEKLMKEIQSFQDEGEKC
ncbi:MAG: TRAP transporter small permease [Desulfobacteraceae bacterium]|nr:TRAP transporter small permease [Desulfobacteraceae bacterium]